MEKETKDLPHTLYNNEGFIVENNKLMCYGIYKDGIKWI